MNAALNRLIRWLALPLAAVVISLVVAFLLARVLNATGVGSSTAIAVILAVIAVSVGLLLWAIVLKVGFRRTLLGTLVVAAVVGLWVAYSTVIWRDEEYRRITDGFKTAALITKRDDPDVISGSSNGWNESLLLSGGVRVTIRARAFFGAATAQYSDEVSSRNLLPPRDYTTVIDVRREGDVLYVLRGITLVGTERRLTVFDLARREVIADRRVGSDDVRSD